MTGKLIGRLGVLLLIGAIGHAQAQTDEENVGKAGAAQVLGGAALVVSPQSQQYVNLVGNAVAKQSGSNYKWHFGVIKSDAINAFALPGGAFHGVSFDF